MNEMESLGTEIPILYSFRRCPYAIRARMAIAASGQACALREVVLKNKPPQMIAISPKGTVPIMLLPDGRIIEESLDIMHWALDQNDPEGWLKPLNNNRDIIDIMIAENDGPFKRNLDRYKYATRYGISDPTVHRTMGVRFLKKINTRLKKTAYLSGSTFTFADAAIVPFIRQFANHNREWFNSLKLSALQYWLQRILESDRFLSVMQKYPTWEINTKEPVFPSD